MLSPLFGGAPGLLFFSVFLGFGAWKGCCSSVLSAEGLRFRIARLGDRNCWSMMIG